MELVLSPGRFSDETPGVPFQNEEVREWSHVDRLTGMLERARVETEKWQTSNQGAARSYGKVIDSRERNSADGSVVQRARRQVEIFQSQGRGRSVQVVRASQWSSSRVTDSSSTNSPTLPVLNKKDDEKFVNSSKLVTNEKSLSREEAISERLSNLLGAYNNYPVSSTVPMRRIDSKYSSRGQILKNPKRSTSNEDIASLTRETIVNNGKKNFPLDNRFSNPEKSLIKFHDNTYVRDDNEKAVQPSAASKVANEQLSKINSHDESAKSTKSAIQLLPSSKSNRTVVNLIKDTRTKLDNEFSDDKRSPTNWHLPKINLHNDETTTKNFDNLTSRRDEKIDDSTIFLSSNGNKPTKRVGFCKTEIHFAADSGKVNIVETDEKPPPTNKFRRRRRLTGVASEKTLSNVVTSLCEKQIDDKKENFFIDRFGIDESGKVDFQRGHTTTVKLGCELLKNNDRANEETKKNASSETEKDSLPAVPVKIDLKTENYDVVCTDAENNQVVLKVVTTHEPTIARVENDHFRKRTKHSKNNEKTSKSELLMKKKSQNEHTYVNVFTDSERAPIYENYKMTDFNQRKVNKHSVSMRKEAKPLFEKLSRVSEAKNRISPSNNCTNAREMENLTIDKITNVNDEKTTKISELSVNSPIVSKKTRIKTKDDKTHGNDKKTFGEVKSLNFTDSPENLRLRANKISKNSSSNGVTCKNFILSCERDSRLSNRSNRDNSSKSIAREISSTRGKKNETRTKPMEVVYQTAVYNMKNEKLSKPAKGTKESRGPRYLNELICGAKTKRPNDSKSKTSSMAQHSANNKGASQTVRHWK